MDEQPDLTFTVTRGVNSFTLICDRRLGTDGDAHWWCAIDGLDQEQQPTGIVAGLGSDITAAAQRQFTNWLRERIGAATWDAMPPRQRGPVDPEVLRQLREKGYEPRDPS